MLRPISDGKKLRGFSIPEIKEAGLTGPQASRIGLVLDKRRKSLLEENVRAIKEIAGDKIPAPPKKKAPAKKKAAKKVKSTPLNEIKGVGPKKEKQFQEAGINSAEELLKADVEKLAQATGISENVIQKHIDEAKKI